MRSEVSHPTRRCPQSLRKRDRRKKTPNLLESDEQCTGAPLSHLRKIPSATSGSNKGVKIVWKALLGAIARHSGDGKFYAMPHNEALVGGLLLTPVSSPSMKVTRASFRPGRPLWPNGKIF